MKQYDILYKGRKIYKNLSMEECTEILQDFSERFYSGEEIDPSFIEMEEITYGNE
jgi:response regulator RpfG family c-di-GMP phosphodiesterase